MKYRPLRFVPALMLLAMATSYAQTDSTGAVAAALRDITRENMLRVTLSGGETVQGNFTALLDDTLVIDSHRKGDESALLRVPTETVRRLEKWTSSTARGAKWGATTGAVAVGALGGFMGWVMASLDEGEDTGTVLPILAGATLGALSGAIVVGGVGAAFGTLSDDWVIIYPPRETRGIGRPSGTIRLFLDVSEAWNVEADFPSGVFGARLGLLKDMSSHVQMGPAIGFYNFEQRAVRPLDGGTSYRATDPVTNMGLDVVVSSRNGGFAPYVVAGTGWYVSSDLYLGLMGGAGLRWRNASGQDYHLDARRHVGISGDVVGGVDDFWTVSAGITFGNP